MIYCSKINDYVEQEKRCIHCIFYLTEEDTCNYDKWMPGMVKDNDK